MAVQTISSFLDVSDLLFPVGAGFARTEEYNFSVSTPNTAVTIDLQSLVPFADYNPALELIDTRTNTVIPGGTLSDDIAPPGNLNARVTFDGTTTFLSPGVPYKIRVFSTVPINTAPTNGYQLTVNTNQNFTVTERLTNFVNPQTGANINISGTLDSSDFTYDAGGFDSLADEYQLTNLTPFLPVNITLTRLTGTYDSRVEIFDATTATLAASSGDPAGNDSSTSFTPQPGRDYRIV
jgi:hypothetical protein